MTDLMKLELHIRVNTKNYDLRNKLYLKKLYKFCSYDCMLFQQLTTNNQLMSDTRNLEYFYKGLYDRFR